MTIWLRNLLRVGVWTALVLSLVLGAYLIYLDRLVVETFDGRRWSVPAVVYAQPLELYAGAALTMTEVSAELNRLGYQQQAQIAAPGLYKRTGTRLDVHLRGFQFIEHAPRESADNAQLRQQRT